MSTNPRILLNCAAIGAGEGYGPLTASERFVVAHEVAHLLLHRHGALRPATKGEYWQTEFLCDDFARRLLIGDQAVRMTIPSGAPNATTLIDISTKLANSARVPWSVAAHRLADHLQSVGFLRLEACVDGHKVVKSTQRNESGYAWLGVSKKISRESPFGKIIRGLRPDGPPITFSQAELVGIAGTERFSEGAALLSADGIRVALLST
jgi:hypothetical protein